MSTKKQSMPLVAKIRFAGLLGCGLFLTGGEFYYLEVVHDSQRAHAFLILALVAFVVVDQLIMIFAKHPEDVIDAVESLREDVAVRKPDDSYQEKWDQRELHALLEQVQHGSDTRARTEGDIRIATTFFIDFEELSPKLDILLRRGVHFKIIFMNPDNQMLLNARFGVRRDGNTPDEARAKMLKQIAILSEMPKRNNATGSVEVRLSDLMPSGFLVQTREWMIHGLMPVQWSYTEGPRIKILPPQRHLWDVFTDDWNERWNSASPTAKSK